jgi:outer membrane lipoprotein SlyB
MNLMIHSSRSLMAFALAATLAGCNSTAQTPAATEPARTSPPAVHVASTPPAPAKCYDCGSITNVEQMTSKGTGSGMGAVIGAVAGAVAGHQVGEGRGKDAATVAGAIGGGFAGNEIEKRVRGSIYYHVTVAMEDGTTRAVDVDAMNGLGTGSKVKVVGNNLQVAGA